MSELFDLSLSELCIWKGKVMDIEKNRYQGYQREGVTVEEAVRLMLKAVSERKPKVEEVNLMEALGRVAARDCISPVSQPPL